MSYPIYPWPGTFLRPYAQQKPRCPFEAVIMHIWQTKFKPSWANQGYLHHIRFQACRDMTHRHRLVTDLPFRNDERLRFAKPWIGSFESWLQTQRMLQSTQAKGGPLYLEPREYAYKAQRTTSYIDVETPDLELKRERELGSCDRPCMMKTTDNLPPRWLTKVQ